jgi:hypothetical protein
MGRGEEPYLLGTFDSAGNSSLGFGRRCAIGRGDGERSVEEEGGGGRTRCTTSRGRRAESVSEPGVRGTVHRAVVIGWWLVGPRGEMAAAVNGTCGFVPWRDD